MRKTDRWRMGAKEAMKREKKKTQTKRRKNWVKGGGVDWKCDEKQSPAVPAGDRGVGLIEATQVRGGKKTQMSSVIYLSQLCLNHLSFSSHLFILFSASILSVDPTLLYSWPRPIDAVKAVRHYSSLCTSQEC